MTSISLEDSAFPRGTRSTGTPVYNLVTGWALGMAGGLPFVGERQGQSPPLWDSQAYWGSLSSLTPGTGGQGPHTQASSLLLASVFISLAQEKRMHCIPRGYALLLPHCAAYNRNSPLPRAPRAVKFRGGKWSGGQGLGEEDEGSTNCFNPSSCEDDKVLEMDGGDGRTTL